MSFIMRVFFCNGEMQLVLNLMRFMDDICYGPHVRVAGLAASPDGIFRFLP